MTHDFIERMAQKASKYAEQTVHYYNGKFDGLTWEQRLNLVKYEKFAALVAAYEREECAKVCDVYTGESTSPMNFAENCAKSIRARGKK